MATTCILVSNIKGADQIVQMCKLICAFNVCILYKLVSSSCCSFSLPDSSTNNFIFQLFFLLSALEGSSEAQPMTILQRSVSLSAGEITPSVVSKGSSSLSPRRDKKPSIDELRKQVSMNRIYLKHLKDPARPSLWSVSLSAGEIIPTIVSNRLSSLRQETQYRRTEKTGEHE